MPDALIWREKKCKKKRSMQTSCIIVESFHCCLVGAITPTITSTQKARFKRAVDRNVMNKCMSKYLLI